MCVCVCAKRWSHKGKAKHRFGASVSVHSMSYRLLTAEAWPTMACGGLTKSFAEGWPIYRALNDVLSASGRSITL